MKRSRPVSLVLVSLFLWQTGCTSYKHIGIADVADHGRIRVTLLNGNRETLKDTTADADSLRGRQQRNLANRTAREVAIAISDVAEVKAASTNVGATVALAVGVALVIVAGIGLYAMSQWDMSWGSSGSGDTWNY